MKELAEALKARAGIRIRQGVVTAVNGATVSVAIGGSTVAVDEVHHLNSCAPEVDDVVWIASDGADLWIIGTHGDPPPIDPDLLPDVGPLPVTTATNVQPNGFTGWTQDPVTVTLTADANGGNGVAATFYTLDAGGITEYTAPIVISAAGSHILRWWSVDVKGNIEAPNVGWVNILSASVVPTGLALTPGIGFIVATWDQVVSARPVTYRVYIGSANPPTTLCAESAANVVTIKRAAADGLTYVAVSTVDVAGNESAKCTAQSATAIGAAADLADHSIGQAKLALSIRPPAIVSSLPALPATEYPAGSTAFLTSDSCLYKTANGTTWVKLVGAGDIQANSITAGEIAAGAVGADELAAKSVFAGHLVVANYDNLIPNPTSEQDVSGAPSGAVETLGVTDETAYAGNKCRKVVGGTAWASVIPAPLIPCTPGDWFYMEAMTRLSAASSGGGAQVWFQFRDADNGVAAQFAGNSNQSTSWVLSSKKACAPSAATSATGKPAVGFYACLMTYNMNGITAYFDNLLLRRMNDANLIVDGAITTDKLAANAVTAAKIAAGTITANEIAAGTITGTEIAASVALSAPVITGGTISGVTITGATLQTAASGGRIVISSTDVRKISLYSGNANESQAATVAVVVGSSTESSLVLESPDYGAGVASIDLMANFAGDIQISVNGNVKFYDRVDVGDCLTHTSQDGFWINDLSTASRRWKLYMYDPGSGYKLYMRYGSGGSEYRSV